jgi:hypothetical protein
VLKLEPGDGGGDRFAEGKVLLGGIGVCCSNSNPQVRLQSQIIAHCSHVMDDAHA